MVEPPGLRFAGKLFVEGTGGGRQQLLTDEAYLGIGEAVEQLVKARRNGALNSSEVDG